MPNSLAKIRQLQGVSFTWNQTALDRFTENVNKYTAGPNATEAETEAVRDQYRQEAYQKLDGRQIGLIAQDVREIVPELVKEDEDGFLKIDYPHLTSILVEAVKEQQAIIESQQDEIDAIKAALQNANLLPVRNEQ